MSVFNALFKVCTRKKKALARTVYVHPARAQLQRARSLDVVDGLRESSRYRLM